MGRESVDQNLTPAILEARERFWYITGHKPIPRVGKKEMKRFAKVYPDSPWNAAFERSARLYRIWSAMRHRCHGVSGNPAFKYYRDKGVIVCLEWRYNFDNFYWWALSHGYDDDLTIDRINNDGNYCPENCRWVTRSENTKNVWRCKNAKKGADDGNEK